MSRIFTFEDQLVIGELGANLFHARYPYFIATNGRKGDFIEVVNQQKENLIELKCDSYYNSPNFFMETHSNEHGKLGGPWQAQENKCDYFVYMFVPERIIYWFLTTELVKWLEEHSKEYAIRYIRNKGWTGRGYLVPRSSLESIVFKKEHLDDALS